MNGFSTRFGPWYRLFGFTLFFAVVPCLAQDVQLHCSSNKRVYQKGEPIILRLEITNNSNKRYLLALNFEDERADPTPLGWNHDLQTLPDDIFFKNQKFLTPLGICYSGKVKRVPYAYSRGDFYVCDGFPFYTRNLICLMPGMKVGKEYHLNGKDGKGDIIGLFFEPGKHKISFHYWIGRMESRLQNYLKCLHRTLRLNLVPNAELFDKKLVSNMIEIEVVSHGSKDK